MGKNQWVVHHDNKWAVKGEGNSRVTKTFNTQKEAANHAREIAKNQKSEVIIQNRHARIRSKDSYGNDPCPPKDREH